MPSTPAVRRPIDLRAFLICVALSFTWGLQQVAIKAAAPNISPMLQVGIRSGVSALLLLLTNHFWLHEKWGHEVKLRDAVLVGLGFVGEFFFVSEGLRFTSAAHMSVLLYTSPFFAAIGLSIKLPEERLSVIQWAGLLTAFLGIAVAFLVPALLSKETLEGSGWILGDILGLGSGLSWGFTTIMLRTTSMNNAPPSLMLFAQLFMAFVILTPLAFITGQTTFHNSLVGWSSLLFQAVIVSYELPRLELPLEAIPRGAPRGARLHDPDLRRHSLGAPPWRIGRHAVCLRVASRACRPPSHAGEDNSAG